MKELIVLSLVVLVCCDANPYGGLLRSGAVPIVQPSPFPSALPAPIPSSAFRSAIPLPRTRAPMLSAGQVHREFIPAPVQTQSYAPVQAVRQPIAFAANPEPVQVNFQTTGSRVDVQQIHVPQPPVPVEIRRIHEHPHKVIHEVIKPVIQEVREIIQPYRKIIKEIRPVIEEIHTIVHKGERRLPPAPLPLAAVGPAFAPGAALVANSGYKAKSA